MTDYKLVKTWVYSNVSEVRLYAATVQHVIDEHEEIPVELPSIQSAVVSAIVKPTLIEKSHGGSHIFVDETSTNWSGDPLRVPIKMIKGTSARVRTFYFAESSAAREVVWRRGNE